MNRKDYITSEEFIKKSLKDPKVKKAYDSLRLEYEIIYLLTKMRAKYKLTQKQLAEKIGTKQSAISRLESGNYNPTLKFLKKLARAFDKKLEITFK